MIASIKEPTKRVGTKTKLVGVSMEFDDVTTHFKKRAVLKGKFEPPSWRFNHYWFTEDTKTIVNAPAFKKFDAPDKAFLVFLKKNSAGELGPVSGQRQATSSFLETQQDGVMMFEPLLAPKTKVEQAGDAKRD